ncbi:MAG: hypothetical protein KJ583_03345 [Nanoarchaeota archaeon]|nr:hypothetical protein [Nanoarchaeota archaeon]MBU1270332.1 hypothetical protein [Nanoarchaeota archaeon]MBU1604329.1 hypothetical protein [Nanoarchaeota archaeon]MBU2443572.1 hypothetical protein [Nanoarchaeota archaeon]
MGDELDKKPPIKAREPQSKEIDELETAIDQLFTNIISNHLLRKENYNVKIDVLPNEALDNKKIYLGMGRMIIKENPHSGFHVYDISTYPCHSCGFHTELDRLSEREFSSVDEVLRSEYVPENLLGTIAIAKNSEKHLSGDTFFSILKNKYEAALRKEQL